MTDSTSKRPWEQRLHEAAANVEDELRRVITYINDEVVPEVRQNSSRALRAAAVEMERLAQKMDERAGPRPGSSAASSPTPEETTRP